MLIPYESESWLTVHGDTRMRCSFMWKQQGPVSWIPFCLMPHWPHGGCVKASDADIRGEGTELDFQVQRERGNL